MAQRRQKQRKGFSCKHLGSSQDCPRCHQIVQIDESQAPDLKSSSLNTQSQPCRVWQVTGQHTTKQQWQQSFAADPIDLTHLPKPIIIKTRKILAALDQGVPPAQLQGKRFSFDRTLLRFPVTYRYRLLCRWYVDRIIPLQVLSHEDYNAVARNKKRLNG
ncbi:hypothetical protein [Stenomitos frigidus]|uniref:ParE family toxin-like protein n=1 Tax=Stenomitos frigidus TaxID=1886765 RepID=UPI001FE7A5D9|nr:hypothetical protein [Stenomitos frigidus]